VFTILDRYILRQLAYAFTVWLLTFVGLMVVLNAFIRLQDFMDAAHAVGRPGFGVLSVMARYFAVRLPVFFHVLCPAAMLGGAMFTMAQLNRNNELTPMRASGISLYRTLAPVFLFAFAVTGVLVAVQESVIPALVPQLQYTEAVLRGGSESVFENLDLTDAEGNNWDLPRFRRGEDRIEGRLLITRYHEDTAVPMTQLTARAAVWRRTAGDRVPRWHLYEGTETRRDENGERLSADDADYETRFGTDDEAYVILRPDDATDDPFRVVSDFTPADIVDVNTSVMYQSTAALRRVFASNPDRRDVAVAIHQRYAFPVANVVLLLLGLPFVLRTGTRSIFGGLLICICICGAFYGLRVFCNELGRSALHPAVAAWTPIALFGPLGIFFFDSVRT
jgi:lipopolysaccharide export system permease protein